MWELLDRLQNLRIRLELVDGKLFVDSPPGTMTDEIRASIRLH